MDELKRLVIASLDKNGVLAELRSNVKLHVARAINDDGAALVHQPSQRVATLMETERGQLMTELMVDFLRHYELKDTLAMLMIEAGLPKLRPSETQVANQCGFSYSSSVDLSVIEQLLQRQSTATQDEYSPLPVASPTYILPAVSPPEGFGSPDADVSTGLGGTGLEGNNSPLEMDSSSNRMDEAIDSLILHSNNVSLENDMDHMRRISAEIDRISNSPRYENDFESDSSPQAQTVSKQRNERIGLLSDDNVVFESRESFKDLDETPAYMHPMEANEHIEFLGM